MTTVIKTRRHDAAAAAAEGARVLGSGGLVGFATETVYGIGADASNPAAMERLRELKNRPAKPFSVHIGRPDDIHRYVAEIPPLAQRLIAKAWPGPVTLLLATGGRLADKSLQRAGLHDVLTSDGVIGIRCPDEPVANAMLAAVAGPVVASSANPARSPSARSAAEVLEYLDGKIDLLIDSGSTRHGRDSTIVSFAAGQADQSWSVVRAGVYDDRTLRKLMRHKVMFVCTGNTCRSPLAAGLARKMLADRLKCKVGELRGKGIEIGSAGIFAGHGARATPEAVGAAADLGADIAHHSSRPLTEELIHDADVIFCMTEFHVAEVRRLAPQDAHKVRRLDEHGDIPDPIGGGPGVYRKTAERIQRAIRALLDEGSL